MWHSRCILSIILLQLFAGPFVGLMAASHETDEAPAVIHIMAVVPTTKVVQGNVSPKWTKGEEILPGAHLAIQQIAKNSDLLSGFQLKVIPVRVPSCDFNEGIIPFVKELTSENNNIIAVVGFFCQTIAQHFSQLLQYQQIGMVHISVMSLQIQGRDNFSNVRFSIMSLMESVSRAALQLLYRLKWKNIAVLSNQNLDYLTAKYTFIKITKEQGINIKLALNIKTINGYLKEVFLHELHRHGIKIVVAFVTSTEAKEILLHAHRNGFKWPDYGWIFANTEINLSECAAMNSAIFLQPELKTQFENDIPPSGLNYSAYHNAYLEHLWETSTKLNVSLQSNPYSNVMYDSIWAIALTLNHSLNIFEERNLSLANIIHSRSEIMSMLQEELSELSFQGVTGSLNFSQQTAALQTSVHILQIQNCKPVHIGYYSDSLGQLFINDSNFNLQGERPSDTLKRVYVLFPIPLTVIMSVLVVMCFVLTTASMCLFLYFRNQAVIRATSSTLSLFVFMGSYILLLSTQFRIISGAVIVQGSQGSLRTFICTFDIFCLGIGTDILFATVIAKTLRIYYIFRTFGKGSQICSDRGLLFLILSIVSIKIILLVTWTGFDINHLVDTERQVTDTVPPYVQVTQSCQSKYLLIWISLQFGYSTALVLVMVLLAIMTRKIRRGNFKDSKKINMLVIALIFDAFLTVPLWIVLRLNDAAILSQLSYIVGTLLGAFFCQAFLILPKVGPLVLVKIQHMRAWNKLT